MTAPLLLAIAVALQPGEALETENLWGGVLQDEELRDFATATGVVTDPAVFEAIWEAWRPGEPRPAIDFTKSFVLVGTIDGPNRMFMQAVPDEKGNVKPVFGGTKIGGPGFGYLIAVLSREGVKTIEGKPLPEPPAAKTEPVSPPGGPREFARITVRGRVETGIVAIGGETTGAVIRAGDMIFELLLEQPNLRERAEGLNGRPAIVAGELIVKQGVETGQRLLIQVSRIDPAPERRTSRVPRE